MYSKSSHKLIKGHRVCLRLLEDKDIEQIRLWRNQDNVRKWFKDSRLIQREQQIGWFERYKTLDTDYIYIIELLEGDKPAIGQISIYNTDWQAKTAEYGRVIAGNESAKGKGFFYEASYLLLEFWNKTYGITKFFLEVKADNIRAIHLYDLLGFKKYSEKDGFYSMQLKL